MKRKGAVRLELMVFGERKDCITQRSVGTWLQPIRGQRLGSWPMREQLWCQASVRRRKRDPRWAACAVLAGAASSQLIQGCEHWAAREETMMHWSAILWPEIDFKYSNIRTGWKIKLRERKGKRQCCRESDWREASWIGGGILIASWFTNWMSLSMDWKTNFRHWW